MSQFCINCGAPLTENDVFCKNCGAKVDVEQQVSGDAEAQTPPISPQQAQVPPKKKSNLGLILGIVGGVVGVAIILLVLFLTGVLGGSKAAISDKVDYSDIEGKWYSSDTMIDFDDDGTVRIEKGDDTIKGEYTYDAGDEGGEIESDNDDFDGLSFKLKSDYLKIGDEKYYRDKEEAGYGTPKISQQIVGLWHAVEVTLGGETVDTTFMGMAFEFEEDGGATDYEVFKRDSAGTWEALESGDIELTNEDGDVVTLENIVMEEGGKAFTADTISDGISGSIRLVKTDMESFLAQENELLLKMQGFWWMCGADGYPPVDNEMVAQMMAVEFKGMKMDLYSNGSIEMQGVEYAFDDSDTIYTSFGEKDIMDIGFETVDGVEYLTMTSEGLTRYFMASSQAEYMAGPPEPVVPIVPAVDTRYTSDADIRALILREWSAIYYQDVDGAQDVNIDEDITTLYADGTYDNMLNDEQSEGQWSVENGRLTLEDSKRGTIAWPVFIEYTTQMNAYLLYLEMDNVAPGTYYVYSDSTLPQPTTDVFGSLEAASWGSNDAFEQAVMDGAWQYVGTADFPTDMTVPEYADITSPAPRVLQFGTDDMLTLTYMDGGTGDVPDDDEIEYGFGNAHAYAVAGTYDAPDEEFEVNIHYYIDVQGRLIETVRMYSFDTDEYYIVSNANIYVPYQP